MKFELTAISTLLLVFAVSRASKVLFLPCHLATTHKKSLWSAAEPLAKRGHHVEIFLPNVVDDTLKSDLPNLVDRVAVIETENRLLLDIFKYENNTQIKLDMAWNTRGAKPWDIAIIWMFVSQVCESFLKQRANEFEQLAEGKWDLLAIDPYFAPCSYAIAQRSQAPFVLWSTTMVHATTLSSRCIPAPASYVATESASEDFSPEYFSCRLRNFVADEIWYLVHRWVIERFLVRKALSVDDAFPTFAYDEFEKRALFAVSMYPDTIALPRPRTPDLFVLPASCPAVGELHNDFAKFVDDPKSKGTIVVAFGHLGGAWSIVPREKYVAFRNALRRLKDYRIIWQCDVFEDGEDPKYPPRSGHIWKTKWLPQNELLNHPKTRLFVSHCGLKSVTEALCAGIPIAGMPLFAEQYMNADNLLRRRLGVFIDKLLLSEDYLYDILVDALKDELMFERVRRHREMIADRIISPTASSNYVLERALKQTNRLRLLHSRGSLLSFVRLYSLDAMLFLLGVIVVFLTVAVYSIAVIAKRLLDRKRAPLSVERKRKH